MSECSVHPCTTFPQTFCINKKCHPRHCAATSENVIPRLTSEHHVSSLHFGQNVEMTLGASVCDQLVGPVGVVIGCGQWVVNILFTS